MEIVYLALFYIGLLLFLQMSGDSVQAAADGAKGCLAILMLVFVAACLWMFVSGESWLAIAKIAGSVVGFGVLFVTGYVVMNFTFARNIGTHQDGKGLVFSADDRKKLNRMERIYWAVVLPPVAYIWFMVWRGLPDQAYSWFGAVRDFSYDSAAYLWGLLGATGQFIVLLVVGTLAVYLASFAVMMSVEPLLMKNDRYRKDKQRRKGKKGEELNGIDWAIYFVPSLLYLILVTAWYFV